MISYLYANLHKWPAGKQVYLNGTPKSVSLDLYEAMKNDRNLKQFIPA